MRALILTCSPSSRALIPHLADEQIIAGPHWPDAQDLEGRWLSLRAPTGVRELGVVLSKIPDYQWPDRIVFLHDSESAAGGKVEMWEVPSVACA
ncbi:MAG TPA: hypothetical protein VHN79_06010 [Lacunisphaera sp.]|nr:hypothetical protein [Lacunisphaera sp.]